MGTAFPRERVCFRACCITLFFAAAFTGCSFFAPAPPLPRRAALAPKSSDEEFTSLIDGADIIYFPRESAVFTRRTDVAPRLLDALRRSDHPLAIGWEADGTGDFHRALVTETGKLEAEILELRRPPDWTADDATNAFTRPDDYERFARRPEFRNSPEAKVRAAYEAESMAQQFAAAKIAAYSRDHRDQKILVFLPRNRLGEGHGVPYFVAQKTKARQLILNPRPQPSGPGLMAGLGRRWRLGARGFQVVDSAPVAATDNP